MPSGDSQVKRPCNIFLARLGYRKPEQKLWGAYLREWLDDQGLAYTKTNIIRAYKQVCGIGYKESE
jgi:hypothetical protein